MARQGVYVISMCVQPVSEKCIRATETGFIEDRKTTVGVTGDYNVV